MEVSYALAPSGDPPPCKRALTRALEDWDIVTAEAVLEGLTLLISTSLIWMFLFKPFLSEADYEAWIGEHGWELVPLIAGYLACFLASISLSQRLQAISHHTQRRLGPI